MGHWVLAMLEMNRALAQEALQWQPLLLSLNLVVYIRAGGRQRRDRMCLFLPSATSALLPCLVLLMAFIPAMPLLDLRAPHSSH